VQRWREKEEEGGFRTGYLARGEEKEEERRRGNIIESPQDRRPTTSGGGGGISVDSGGTMPRKSRKEKPLE
jgi:hypothetical protein